MIWNIIILHFLGMISPGPDFFYIVRTAAVHSRCHAVFAALGIIIGVMFWAGSTVLGLSLLLKAFPILNRVLMLAGGLYLAHLGWKMTRVTQNATFAPDEPKQHSEYRPLHEIRKGLLVNLSNPKIVVYFSSVMSGVIAEVQQLWQAAGILGILFLETAVYFMSIAVLFSGSSVKNFYSRFSRYLNNASGVIFIGFGLLLVYRAVF